MSRRKNTNSFHIFFDKNLATMRLPFNHLLEKNRPDVPKFRTSVERTNNCTVHILIEPAFLGEENGGLEKKRYNVDVAYCLYLESYLASFLEKFRIIPRRARIPAIRHLILLFY